MKLKLFKRSEGYCGPTSLRVVLNYYGMEYSEEELAKIIGATKEKGSNPWQIVNGAKKLGLNAYYKKNSSIKELRKLLKQKIPVIVDWNPEPGFGHYSVVTEITKNKIILADPKIPSINKQKIKEFEKKWYENYDGKKVLREIIVIKKPKKSFRKAVFIIVYKKTKNKLEYLLLKRSKHWNGWEFPKGGIEKDETEKETAKREVFEETGLKPKNLRQYKIKGKYHYPKLLKDRPNQIGQTYKLFSAEIDDRKIKIDRREHSKYQWFSAKEAIKKLTWQNQKKCLKFVNEKLGK